jgi:hypothetical protein
MNEIIIDSLAVIFMLIWIYGVDEPINWRILWDKIRNKKPLKKITVWECLNDKGKFEHNHYEEGHVIGDCPTPKFPSQKSWLNNKWRYYHAYLNDKNVIVMKDV